MALFRVHVTGEKSFRLGSPGRNAEFISLEKAEGQEFIPINPRRICRDGDEPLVIAPAGVKCSGDTQKPPHKIEPNEKVYDLGIVYSCKKHIGLIPTISDLKQEYKNTKLYRNIKFDGKPIDEY